jgi:murein DD-endopeptidase MepM/ murein hydrolase activator NlpD
VDPGKAGPKRHPRRERPGPAPAPQSRPSTSGNAPTAGHEFDHPTASSPPPSRAFAAPPASHTAPGPSIPSARPGAGVADLSLTDFRIPPFLLPVYKEAGHRYGVPWEVLAAINEIETDYGRNVAVSSAGAQGWMQFMPATWEAYGVDANGDGVADPNDPADAIFAAARYLRAAGAGRDLRRAIFAYNHADWYVESVLQRARRIMDLPGDLVGSLTQVAEGRFPVTGHASYTDGRKQARIFARDGAPVVAVNDGRIVGIGQSDRLGRFVRLRDRAGTTYTYAGLGRVRTRRTLVKNAKMRLHARRDKGIRLTELRPGARVVAGAVLGNVSATRGAGRAHVVFQIRPAGRRPRPIDPGPILAGWQLGQTGRKQSSTDGDRLRRMSDRKLGARVLADRRIDIYACGREDIESGRIDRRVLAMLELLAEDGLHPTVSAMKCGHSLMTTSGNISEHSTGDAVDISAINGIPIAGHQGPGSITDITIRRLLDLQGAMAPHQIISLMAFPQAPNTLAMPDHADHIHVGWRPR